MVCAVVVQAYLATECSGLCQKARYLQSQIEHSQMFVCAVNEALVNVRKLHDNVILLPIAQCIVVNDPLVELDPGQ